MYLPLLCLLLLSSCLTHQAYARGRGRSPPDGSVDPSSRITVVGVVYCDTCSINTFSRQSYFLQGVEVHVSCRFKASSPKTAEEVNISVNRTTNRNGVYKLEIPHVDGIDCVDGIAIASQCSAKLLKTSDDNVGCNIPVFQTATNEVSVKSKQDRVCIYSLSALSYKPSHRNTTLCGGGKRHRRREKEEEEKEKKFRESKFFWPYMPPYWFPWPSNLPPLPTLPTLPSFPFPSLPFGNPNPALPAFDWRDPMTWIPYLPRFPPGDHNP
ncbi:unnamed protein product [Microthlaspi erraticum]|uniref:Pollen Ole e 1 allergen and extensin family protein n=1 Tax=Microthlaspi erraticum TaxID=1685480 RepID=A0A6D2JJI6_9BRAS|nr:unnamed protein product [Microthlaspi erraticum]